MIRLILLFSAAVSPSFESAAWNSAMDRASSCFEQSDYHCALAALQSLDNDDLNDLAKATLLTRLGAVYFRLGDFRTAQTTYIKAIGLWERAAPRDVSRVVSLTSLSTVDHRLGEYSKAEKTARQALDALDQCDANLAETAAGVQNLAAIYQTEGNYSEAERLYRRAAGIVDLSSALSWIAAASAHSNLGRLMGETGRTEEGLREIHEALELWQSSISRRNDTAKPRIRFARPATAPSNCSVRTTRPSKPSSKPIRPCSTGRGDAAKAAKWRRRPAVSTRSRREAISSETPSTRRRLPLGDNKRG